MASAGGGSRDNDNDKKRKRSPYKRLTSGQLDKLETFMKECDHPNESQRNQLAEEVGLEPKQIKFWFQNKRTLLKNQHEKGVNTNLRVENEMIKNETLLMKEALKGTLCIACGGPPFPKEEHEDFMHKMEKQNDHMKKECDKVSKLLARYVDQKISLPEFEQALNSIEAFRKHKELQIQPKPTLYGSSNNNHGLGGNVAVREGVLMNRSSTQNFDEEKMLMSQIANFAMEELVRLVRVNEPFWINYSNTQNVKYTLHGETYEQVFPKHNHFRGPNVCEESSKYSEIVMFSGMKLVDTFLDPAKWTNMFPTIVTKAETIKVFETGLPGNRDGALLQMREEMHVLSPLVTPRHFDIIRFCKQLDAGVWVITDVSIIYARPNTSPLSCSWKHPSGCMIREMPNGYCYVTWVEHVEVEDRILTHPVYKDFVGNYSLYGAVSWIEELQRMSWKFFNLYLPTIPVQDAIGVMQTIEGKMSLMKLSHRMIKMFCECLAMKNHLEFQPLNVDDTIGGIRVSISNTNGIGGQPNSMVVTAVTTIWLPLHAEKVFEFLKDPIEKYQWDVLSFGKPMQEIRHISNGIYHGNYTSILQPCIPDENNTVILQENFNSSVGSYVIYAPIDATSMSVAIRGEDTKNIRILPSGFVVCSKSIPNATFEAFNNIGSSSNGGGRVDGTLLTFAYQILTSSPNGIDYNQNMETIANINTLLSVTIKRVRNALMNSN